MNLGTILIGIVVVGCQGASPPAPPRDAPPLGTSSRASEPAAEPAEDSVKDVVCAHDLAPREVRGNERDPVRLALGERATFGAWDARWIAVRDGLIRFEGRYRQKAAGEWSASVDPRAATHQLQTRDKLFTFEARLVAINGRPDRADGRVEITAHETDLAPSAAFGQTLSPGVFKFPDGLRVHVEQLHGCDFDVSAPCPFGGSYRADAALDQREAHVDLTSKSTKILGHTLDLGRGTFVVRK
jgi:hypothetical protein